MDRPTDRRARRGDQPSTAPASLEGRVPPYAQEAEEAVLGGILLNNEALFQIQDILKPEDFYVETNRRIFAAVESLSRAGLPVDHVTLGNELPTQFASDEAVRTCHDVDQARSHASFSGFRRLPNGYPLRAIGNKPVRNSVNVVLSQVRVHGQAQDTLRCARGNRRRAAGPIAHIGWLITEW